jgi:hypothetical protein
VEPGLIDEQLPGGILPEKVRPNLRADCDICGVDHLAKSDGTARCREKKKASA